MQHPGFFDRAGPYSLTEVASACDAEIGASNASGASGMPEGPASAGSARITDVVSLDHAEPGHVSFLDNRKYLPQLGETRATACFISPDLAVRVPAGVVPLLARAPYRSFAMALALFYPGSGLSRTTDVGLDDPPIHPTAVVGEGVFIERGAVIGREARIGPGTRIASGAVVGYRCWIGKDTYVGPCASVTHAIVGDRVILHAGVRIGQDGFGFAMGAQGHLKVPQIGRVIVEDDVEIGANSTVDRGALKDTIIGRGSKIDNLVQIGHNVIVGRHCVLVGQVGISGSTELGDLVVMGGQSGTVGHIKVGNGAQIAGNSGVKDDVPPGERWGGTPAKPLGQFAREISALKALVARKKE